MPRNQVSALTYLGRSTAAPATPDEAILDRIPNRHRDTPFVARFAAPEFTVLCAVTGQPDFAHLVIDYVPKNWLIESKSLKFYLGTYRNQNGFHEDTTIRIGKRLVEILQPTYFRIGGYWYPRGGIPIDVFWAKGRLPKNLWLPEQGVPSYRGR
jgi:7-cyano-7-deazaguanine reductase